MPNLFLGGEVGPAPSSVTEVPEDILFYLQMVLWRQGVDVSTIPPDQLYQLQKAIWDDAFIQNMWNAGSLTTDPTTGITLTDSNMESAIGYELFDPTRTHNQFLLSQGLSLLQISGRQLSSEQRNYASNFGGGDPTVMSALARAAQDAHVPYNVALAVAMAESGLNPDAHHKTSREDSWGLFQLNTMGGEGQGMTQAQLVDPYTNALTALRQFAAVAQADPSVTSDPGRWAAAAQRPADPSGYAVRVNNLLQSGFGGSPTSIVPTPFDAKFFRVSGYGYGAPDNDFQSGVHEGVDYGVPMGTPLYSPFAGTVIAQWNGGYGNQVKVRLDNGYEISFGHMSNFSVVTGQRVNPGDLLGQSGSTGNSTGPHVHLEWRTPGGNPMDPSSVLNPIFTGAATFRDLNLSGAEGQGISATAARDRLLGIDPALEAKYPTAVNEFEKYFGRHPTSGELTDLIAHGTTADQLEQYLRTKPSHIPGLSIGIYQDVKGNLDAVSQKLFGHPGTDGMVKELADQGKTSPTAVEFWLTQQDIAGRMEPGQYATLHALNAPSMNAIYNEPGFDPRIAARQYQQAQAQGVTVPSSPHNLSAFPYGPADRAATQGEPGGGSGSPDYLLSTQ